LYFRFAFVPRLPGLEPGVSAYKHGFASGKSPALDKPVPGSNRQKLASACYKHGPFLQELLQNLASKLPVFSRPKPGDFARYLTPASLRGYYCLAQTSSLAKPLPALKGIAKPKTAWGVSWVNFPMDLPASRTNVVPTDQHFW
jgi:hypothetical protein